MLEVINYERVTDKDSIIGYATIKLPRMVMPVTILRRIAHFQKGDRRWFNLPSFSVSTPQGKEYPKFWEFESQTYNADLLEKLPELVKLYCHENKIPEIEPLSFDIAPSDLQDLCPF